MSNATQTEAGAVVSLWRYPVKSMMGEELNSAQMILDHGLLGDRVCALVDGSDGKVATAKNPRKWPNLFAFRATFLDPDSGAKVPAVRITLPDGLVVTGEQRNLNQVLSKALNRDVTLVTTGRDHGPRRSSPLPASSTAKAEEW